MEKYSDIVLVVDTPGAQIRAPASASVQVLTSPGGIPASIFSDNGVTTQPNPITADSSGEYSFYAADGLYSLVITVAGYATETKTAAVMLFDSAGGSASPTFDNLTLTGNLIVQGNTTLGDASADTLTINARTWTLGSNYTATRVVGVAAASFQDAAVWNTTFSGDSGGTTDFRALSLTATAGGAAAIAGARVTRGTLTISNTALTTNVLFEQSNIVISAAGGASNATVFDGFINLTSSGAVAVGTVFKASTPTLSSTGAFTNLFGFIAGNLGHATLVGSVIAFEAANMTASASLTVSFRSLQNSGTGCWGFLHNGTANNAFNGSTRFGSNVAPTETVHVTGTLATSGIGAVGTTTSSTTALNLPASTTGVSSTRLAHGAAPSAPVNGDMWTTTAGLFVRINGATVGPLS